MTSISMDTDISGFSAAARRTRAGTLPAAGVKLKEFADRTMEGAKNTVDQYYTAGGAWSNDVLAQSGRVEDPVYEGTTIVVEASFGKTGPASTYALHVHEGHHQIAWGHDTGKSLPPAKYWEIPLMGAVGNFEQEVGMPVGVEILKLWGGR